jgi:hypothetical protein
MAVSLRLDAAFYGTLIAQDVYEAEASVTVFLKILILFDGNY